MVKTLSFGDDKYEDVLFVAVQGYNLVKARHNHTFAEIVVVCLGELIHEINGETEVLKKGDAVFIFPEDSHKLHAESNCEIVNLSMSLKVLSDLNQMIGISRDGNDFMHYLKRNTVIPSYKVKNLVSESADFMSMDFSSIYYRTRIKAIILDLLSDFIDRPSLSTSSYSKMPAWMSEICKAYDLKENLAEGLGFAYRLAMKSPEHIAREFKKHFSMTPLQYVNNKRIAYCKNMLISTNLPIAEICYEVGYESLAAFYARFKELTGITPSVFRKKYGKIDNYISQPTSDKK